MTPCPVWIPRSENELADKNNNNNNIIYSCLYREPQTHQWPSLGSLWLKALVRRKKNQPKVLIKSLITKYQKLKKLTLHDRGPQH